MPLLAASPFTHKAMPCLCPRVTRGVTRGVALGLLLMYAVPAVADAATLDTITLDTVTLDTVTVSASTVSQPATPHAAAATNSIKALDLHRRAASNTADALRYVPGVNAYSDAGGVAQTLSIRGTNLNALSYDNSGVIIYRDGLPVTAADGSNHNRFIDPLSASSMTVMRGGDAMQLGASALGGAMNYASPTARNSISDSIFLQAGSAGARSLHASKGAIKGDLDGYVGIAGRHYDGYRQHSRLNRASLHANVGWQATDQLSLRLHASHLRSHQQLAGALTRAEYADDPQQAAPSYATGDHQLNVTASRIAVTGEWRRTNGDRLQFGIANEYQTLYHPIVTSPYFSLLIDNHQNTTAAHVDYLFARGDHHWQLGIASALTRLNGRHYNNMAGHPGTATQQLDQTASQTSLRLFDHWQWADRWTLTYGAQAVIARRDLQTRELADNSKHRQHPDYASVNPRAELAFTVNDRRQWSASATRLYQAPDNFELDNADVSDTGDTLDAMHGIEYQLGSRGRVNYAHGHTRWQLAVYWARIKDEVLSSGQPGQMHAANYAATRHAGIEASLGGRQAISDDDRHYVSWQLAASLNDFRFVDDARWHDKRLPGAPQYQLAGEMLYHYRPSGAYAGITYQLQGARYADMANHYRVDPYALIGLRAGILADSWELYLQANNLTDKRYVAGLNIATTTDTDSRLLKPGAPRSVHVGWRYFY